VDKFFTWSVVTIGLLTLSLVAAIWFDFPLLSLGALLVAFSMIAWYVVNEGLQLILIKSIALLLPFSVEVPFFYGSMLRVPTEPLIAIALLVLILEVFISPREWTGSPLRKEFLWALPFMAVFLLTIPFSDRLLVSLKFSFVNIAYLLVFYVFLSRYLHAHPTLFQKLITLYGIGFLLVAVYGLVRFWQFDWNPVVVRGIFQPFYKDHTIFGAAGALLAVCWIGLVKTGNSNQKRLVYGLPVLAFCAAVVLSASRAALLSLAVPFLVILAFRLNIGFRRLMVVGLGITIGLAIFHKPLLNRLRQADHGNTEQHGGVIDRMQSVTDITTNLSNLERMNRWVSAWRMFRERPLTGFGPGTYQFEYIPFQDPTLMSRLTVHDPGKVPEGSGGTAHSEYLLALSEMGVFGLLTWLLLIGRWIYLAFARIPFGVRRTFVQIAFAAMATYLFHAFFNNFLTTDKFAFLFWGTGAWLIANYHAVNDGQDVLPAG
jgi:putative inorganic carbon (hco3(-)) transporter